MTIPKNHFKNLNIVKRQHAGKTTANKQKNPKKRIIRTVIRLELVEISIEPWKKLIIHQVTEYKFDDWVKQLAFNIQTSGGGIPTLQWVDGIVFSPISFPRSNITTDEQLKGTLHWLSVTFAIKEKFERQIIKENATINLVDVSIVQYYKELATTLKSQSKYIDQKS